MAENFIRVREALNHEARFKVDHVPGSNLMEVLGRCLGGRVGGPEGKVANIRKMSEWIATEWRELRVELLELGGSYVGLIFPIKNLVTEIQQKRWFLDNAPLFWTGGRRWAYAAVGKMSRRNG